MIATNKVKLSEISTLISKGSTPRGKVNYSKTEKNDFLRVTDMADYGRVKKSDLTLSDEDFAKNKMRLWPVDTVLISIEGTIGKVSILKKVMAFNQAVAGVVVDKTKILPEYLMYYLKSESAFGRIVKGTIMPAIRLGDISNLDIDLPSLNNQKKIVDTLEKIDSKIGCNNRTNDNLREIIKARYNYLIKSTDWPKIELGTVATISSGKRPAAKIASGRVPVVGANGVMAYTNDYNFNEDVIITGRVGTLGAIKRYNDKIWASDNTLVIQTKYLNYVENYLKNLDIQSLNRGSTQPLLTNGDLKKQIIMFNESGVLKFERENQIIIDTIRGNNLENEHLTKLRDTLLPELLNGKIDISNIDI